MLIGAAIEVITLANGQNAMYANKFERLGQRNMTSFELPPSCVGKSCLVRWDYEVKGVVNMKTSVVYCIGGFSINGAWRDLTPCHGINGGWRPSVGTRGNIEFTCIPATNQVTFMQWWSGSGRAGMGHYMNDAWTQTLYLWNFRVYWN